jgi:SAM-dependent methyltransferase
MDEYRAANRANWDDRASLHAASRTYDVDRFVDDPERLSGVVEADRWVLGDLAGLRVVHLQCHIGTDTLSLARLGAAETVGYDFSPASLAEARALVGRTGDDVTFVEGELYDAPAVLGRGRFDLVYTGVGALCWLPDIRAWAEVVADLLADRGRLVIRDGHPVLNALDDERDDDLLVLRHPYFEVAGPLRWDEDSTYTDAERPLVETTTYEWNHSIGELLTAVLDAGLVIDAFREHRELEWPHTDRFVPLGDGRYGLPEPQRDLAPLMFTLAAHRPGAG